MDSREISGAFSLGSKERGVGPKSTVSNQFKRRHDGSWQESHEPSNTEFHKTFHRKQNAQRRRHLIIERESIYSPINSLKSNNILLIGIILLGE